MPKPQPKNYPFTNAFSGGDFSQIRGVTEHYFPSRYSEFTCIVNSFDIEIKNFREMEVRTRFVLSSTEDAIKTLYTDEGWKFMRTEELLKRFPALDKKLSTPAPLFALMLNKYLQVVDAKLTRKDGKDTAIVYDTDADMLTMPTSFPPLADMGEEDNYVFYDKKSVVFYSDIQLDVEYEVVVSLEANAATFEFAPLFPYGTVQYKNISAVGTGEYEIVPNAWKVGPERNKEFPEWFQYQLDKIASDEIVMPRFRPALPHRGTFPAFNLMQQFEEMIDTQISKKDILEMVETLEIDIEKPVELKDYETLRFGFVVGIPEDKNIDVIVRTIQRPLPPRIYEQMQKLPNYRDTLVEYTIFNLSHEKLRLRVETEIIGYTEKETKVIFLYGINNKMDRKAQLLLNQCPRLKKDILEELAVPANATMLCKVTNEDTKDVLFEETFPIDILTNDEMVWELQDLRSNHTYNLRDFVCAWITPTDKAGLLDKARSEARAFHPDNTLGHKLDTFEDVKFHVKALYDYLASKGMNYLSQPFSSKTSGKSQRVIMPEKVLANNAGNCIDLTILFASLLEGFGLYSLIFLTPTHAFIGWGNKNNADQIIALETTLIGREDFETALAAGKKAIEDNFTLKDGTGLLYMPDLRRMDGNYIVDTQKARHSGRVSIRKA